MDTRTDNPGPISCRQCDLNAICRLTGLDALKDTRSRSAAGSLRKVAAGKALFRAGTPATALFAIRQGTVKLARITTEGDERVESFHVPGDVLGLEAFSAEAYACDAIALDTVQYCELPLPSLESSEPRTAAIASELVRLLSKGMSRTHLARGTIRHRVTNFLQDLSKRLSQRGLDGTHLKLAMSRLEIANLLDTRIETVSRVLQQLHRERAIQIRGSRVLVGRFAFTS
jgi:CRP/FNR family transcriptional regulator, anaerobic regulatory protein